MSATYGLRSSGSSASAALQQSLASRLPARLGSRGSTMFAQTWKAQATPLRRRISAHTASAHRTSGSGSTGWPTPNAGPQNDSDSTWQERREALKQKHGNGNGFGLNLGQAVTLAPWPTTTRQDAASSGSAAYSTASGRHSGTTLTDAARMASWPTCKSTDGDKGGGWSKNGQDLVTTALLASPWATPQARDHKGANNPGNELTHNARPLNEQVRLAAWARKALTLGETSNGSPAATAKPGQLNPAFSLCFLMGYPVAWLLAAPSDKAQPRFPKKSARTGSTASASCVEQATPSSRKSQRRSSEH